MVALPLPSWVGLAVPQYRDRGIPGVVYISQDMVDLLVNDTPDGLIRAIDVAAITTNEEVAVHGRVWEMLLGLENDGEVRRPPRELAIRDIHRGTNNAVGDLLGDDIDDDYDMSRITTMLDIIARRA